LFLNNSENYSAIWQTNRTHTVNKRTTEICTPGIAMVMKYSRQRSAAMPQVVRSTIGFLSNSWASLFCYIHVMAVPSPGRGPRGHGPGKNRRGPSKNNLTLFKSYSLYILQNSLNSRHSMRRSETVLVVIILGHAF